MTQTTAVEIGSIRDVLAFFAIGAAREITPIQNGLSNHNYIVVTDRGGYVVKFLAAQALEHIENDIAIQQQLRKVHIDAPQYLRNPHGDYLYRGADGLNAVISRKIDGVRPHQMTPALAENIGRHLARFHRSVTALPRPNNAGLMNPAVASVDSPAARAIVSQPLPRGIIHGDLHAGNVLVDPLRPHRVVAITDFEDSGENLLVLDLAVTIMGVSSADPSEGQFRPELMQATLLGYETVRVLSDDEYTWLPSAIAYASEAWINWFAANGFDGYADKHRRLYAGFQYFWHADPDEERAWDDSEMTR